MATVVLRSENRKLGKIAATYTAKHTCPQDCPMLRVCYGKAGPLHWQWLRVTKAAPKNAFHEIAEEARKLTTLPDGSIVRLHVVGDCGSNRGARLLAKACARLSAFTYTHFWRKVARRSWGKVAVLASCETTRGVKTAQRRGYATALVVGEFESEKAYYKDGLKLLPCPEQTGRAKSCAACRLCFDDARLTRIGVTIAFRAHGPRHHEKFIARHLASLQ